MANRISVLLCSPFYPDKEETTCGLANWTRNILSQDRPDGKVSLKLIPFDRSVDLNEESSLLKRVVSGLKDYPTLIRKATKELRSRQYDIIQVSSNGSIGMIKDYFIARKAKKYGARLLVHHHFGRIPELLSSNGWESRLLRLILKKAYGNIVMDKASYDALKEMGYKNVFYLPNPLSDKWFNQIEEYKGKYDRDASTLLFVGHVVKTKGIYELVTACDEIPAIKLRVVGKVTETAINDLNSLCKKRPNNGWLSFVGEISHMEVLIEMAKCGLFVLPTYTEGFPNVILESMASYCPIITTSVGAIPEMLDSNNDPCGCVIRPQDSEAVRKAIITLMADKDERECLGEKAGRRVRQYYTTQKVWNRLEGIWTQIIQ